MKKIFLILTILLILILVVVPFLLPINFQGQISVVADLVSALASVITLIIAILLFNKYGIEKSVLEKQTERVFQLLAELKSTSFWLEPQPSSTDQYLLQIHLDNLNDAYWEKYKDKEVLFGGGYITGLRKIWKMSDDIFLPREIAMKLKPLKVHIIKVVYAEKAAGKLIEMYKKCTFFEEDTYRLGDPQPPLCAILGLKNNMPKVLLQDNEKARIWLNKNSKNISAICAVGEYSWIKMIPPTSFTGDWKFQCGVEETQEETKRFIAVVLDNVRTIAELRLRLSTDEHRDWLSQYIRDQE